MVGIRTSSGECVNFFKTSFIFLIFSLHVGCKGELLRPHPHVPTTQPTQHTLDRPPLAHTPLAPSPSPTHPMHLGRPAWREKETKRPTVTHSMKKGKKSPASKPPPTDSQWKVSWPQSPSPHRRSRQTPFPRYTLRQPKRRYYKRAYTLS
ncbi:hypothetical protein E2C01_094878 [Portunus trituberculatus]|uniref:Uncharacterized protein n=1 Tax=Portunus trituberculatus TaxID=210409 RepID=A0A5B7K4C1_PORTR|nr:hypothetical protein [Portunus trituberculatus]